MVFPFEEVSVRHDVLQCYVTETILRNGTIKSYEEKEDLIISFSCKRKYVDDVYKSKYCFETGCLCFEAEDEQNFAFLEKVWMQSSDVITLKQMVRLADSLEIVLNKMLVNKQISKVYEDEPIDFDVCFEIIESMFKPFVELHKECYLTNALCRKMSKQSIGRVFLGILDEYVVLKEGSFLNFEIPFMDIFQGFGVYSKIAHYIGALGDKKTYVRHKMQTYIAIDYTSYCKIGKSTKVEEREKQLKIGNSSIKMIVIIDEDVEKELHKYYEKKNVNGEWFKLSKSDIQYVCSHYKVVWKDRKAIKEL